MLNARDLARMEIDAVWELPDGPMKLMFDDGIIETDTRQTIFSRYIWEIHRIFPDTPMLMAHHIRDKRLGSSTHIDLLSAAIWDCFDAYQNKGGVDMEFLSQMAYQITNRIYNDFTLRLEEYVSSISILDFIDAMDHPIIDEANRLVKPNNETAEHTIEKTYDKIRKVLLDPVQLTSNGVAKAAKSGLVSLGQILQCIGPRGYPTDIDSHIFRRPILRGFAHGLNSLEDMMKESRSAAKALYFTKDPMAKSEYFNRNIQLSAATLSNLHMVDCGSKETIPFTVKPGDLKDLIGIHHWDTTSNTFRAIRDADKHLVGKTIQIRSVFTCKHPDPRGVCVRCFGDLGLSVPRFTNIGHLCSTELQAQVSQRILSTKHEDTSSSVEDIALSDYERKYLKIGPANNLLMVSDQMAKRPFSICILEEEAPNLFDVIYVEDTKTLVPTRISELTSIQFLYTNNGVNETPTVQVSVGNRLASLSAAALEYIKKVNWTVTDDGRYCIDMSGWNPKEVFLELPLKHFSTVDYMKTIEAMIKGNSRRGMRSLVDYDTPSAALMGFHDLVSSKLSVNVSHLQVIVLSTMVRNEETRDYHLPTDRMTGKFAPYNRIMALRSLSAMMAFQGQAAALYSPESYVIMNRPPHPLDDLVMG